MAEAEIATLVNTASQAGGSLVLAYVVWRLYKDVRAAIAYVGVRAKLEIKLTLDKEGLPDTIRGV
jgi:hypothetical protein